MGVSCIEISIEPGDNLADALSVFASSRPNYQVIKLSFLKSDLIFEIQEKGFRFVEVITQCTRSAHTPKLNGVQSRFVDSTFCEISSETQKQEIKKAISSGMFNTDRVSIDPAFTKLQSANRFLGWLHDEVRLGAKIYSLVHDDDTVGFFILRNVGNGEMKASIGGIFSDYLAKGYGLCLNYHEIKEAEALEAKTISVAYSSNNPVIGKINKILGYKEISSNYVFVRHQK